MTEDLENRLIRRPRRLRRSGGIRAMVRENRVTVDDLIAPLFVVEEGEPEPVESMPGVFRLSVADAAEECRNLYDLGIPAVAPFPSIEAGLKDESGSAATATSSLMARAIEAIKNAAPGLVVLSDVALDPYTTHGHDGVLTSDGTDVDNDRTVEILCRMALLHAEAGADFVAPSDMMDGRVRAIRETLDGAGHTGTGIVAYSAKFASAFYGPFRDAVRSERVAETQLRDKRTYQLDPANRREAVLEARIDEAEGADVVMVKPAGPYLDIIREVREAVDVPVAAYQVSGEYAQLHAAAKMGWLDLEKTRDESLLAIKRAGADMILTYFAPAIAREK